MITDHSSKFYEQLGRAATAKARIGLLRARVPYSFSVYHRAGDRLFCWHVLGFSTALGNSARYLLAGEYAFHRGNAGACSRIQSVRQSNSKRPATVAGVLTEATPSAAGRRRADTG